MSVFRDYYVNFKSYSLRSGIKLKRGLSLVVEFCGVHVRLETMALGKYHGKNTTIQANSRLSWIRESCSLELASDPLPYKYKD